MCLTLYNHKIEQHVLSTKAGKQLSSAATDVNVSIQMIVYIFKACCSIAKAFCHSKKCKF